MSISYLPAPLNINDSIVHRRMLASKINELQTGKFNNTLDVTFTASATSTTINDPRIGYTSVMQLMPKTANAAAANTTAYFSEVKNGSLTITHSSTAATDQDFRMAIIG